LLVICIQNGQELTASRHRCDDIWALQTDRWVLWDCMCM